MAGIVKPKALEKGDVVAVVAPSEPILASEKAGMEAFFRKFNHEIKFGANIMASVGDYSAGSARQRADDLNAAFADPNVKAVFSAVGGFVGSQELELLDFDAICKNPKIFAGYSDATTIQMALLVKCAMVTFHSPNAAFFPTRKITGYTVSCFWKMLTTTSGEEVIEPQSVWQSMRDGAAQGVLFGGNLSCICKLLGTPWDPIAALDRVFGKDQKFIFFWEEGYDQFSEIMRNFWQIRNSGFLKRVAGMLVGKLTAVKELDYQNFPTKKELLLEATEPFGFPIIYGVDFGHEVPQATVPVGVVAGMDTKKMRLEILEPAVI
ncbi:MAG: LD-carboxypeptidase [Patescibacteria group bacterium]|nr:LD-carboxypeptidase [Patescibacteria group bacterium]MCL5432171.1 LD-carboxypeptidase [Patescibacteria group bacterium]